MIAPRRPLAALLAVLSFAACDDEKKPAPGAFSSAVPSPSALGSALAAAGAGAAKPSKKKAADCPTGNEVTFSDKALEDEVRRKLAKDGGALTKADLAQVKSLNFTRAPANELDPCVFPLFTGVKEVFLGQGELDDLSPLATLTNIETLRASINQVSDIKPLEKLTKMDRLDLGRTQVREITPVANMVALTELQLDDTQVSDLSPLRACPKLEKLSIKRTLVRDVKPLAGLKKLRFLYIEGAPIEDTSSLDPLVASGMRLVRTGGGGSGR
jgi:internalin A